MKIIIWALVLGGLGGVLLSGFLHWPAFYIGLSIFVGLLSGLIVGCIIDGWLRGRAKSLP